MSPQEVREEPDDGVSEQRAESSEGASCLKDRVFQAERTSNGARLGPECALAHGAESPLAGQARTSERASER